MEGHASKIRYIKSNRSDNVNINIKLSDTLKKMDKPGQAYCEI